MDCDFFEQSYYYSQPRPQGENVSSEDLSWLTHPIVIDPDPKEQVGKTTDVVTENIVSPTFDSFPLLSTKHLEMNSEEVILENEVISDNPEVVSNYISKSNSDHTLFLNRKNELFTCLIIYVDDMIIIGNDKEELHMLKK